MATTKKLPKGMALEQKKIEAAQEGHYYIKVGPKGGSHWVLSGAPSRWKKAENRGDIYVPDFRVAGRVEDLTEALRNTGTDESDIQDALSRAYTAENFDTTMKAEFDAEVDLYRDAKKKKGKVAPEFTLDDLEYIVAHVSSAKRVSRSDARSPRSPNVNKDAGKDTTAPKAAKRGGGGQGLLERLKTVLETEDVNNPGTYGKTLDASGLADPKSGKGIKTVKTPGPAAKRYGVAGFPMISNSRENYEAAMNVDVIKTYLSSRNQKPEDFVSRWQPTRAAAPSQGLAKVEAAAKPEKVAKSASPHGGRKSPVAGKSAPIAGLPAASAPVAGLPSVPQPGLRRTLGGLPVRSTVPVVGSPEPARRGN